MRLSIISIHFAMKASRFQRRKLFLHTWTCLPKNKNAPVPGGALYDSTFNYSFLL